MKLLKNKSTGEIGCLVCSFEKTPEKITVVEYIDGKRGSRVWYYDTLAELNDEWEDYKPAKPLIKDEKVRKAVLAWAEANNVDKVAIQNNYCLSSEEDEEVEIVFARPVFKEYVDFDDFIAIAELCGEEEE